MKRERCPRCGGHLELEGETWTRGERSVRRSYRCAACGEGTTAPLSWPYVSPPSARVTTSGRAAARVAFWTAVLLSALWLVLNALDFGTARVAVYSAVARAAEGFLHPGWLAGLLAVAAGSAVLGRTSRSAISRAAPVADVHLRTDAPGRLSIIVSGERGAMAQDFSVERNEPEEQRIRTSFAELARRTSAFAGGAPRRPGREEVESSQRELYALGLDIGRGLLGRSGEVADAIADLPSEHLRLCMHSGLSGIPWELAVARPGGAFLWQLFSVTRQLRETDAPRSRSARSRAPWRVLLLANPEAGVPGRELPAAEREAVDVLELGATDRGALRVVRKSPRSAEELLSILREGFDVLHFAGHTWSDDRSNGLWVLGEGERVAPADVIEASGHVPALVFANGCSSNPEGTLAGGTDSAAAIMRCGVAAYLCTLAELHDEGSAAFSASFYRALAGGAALGAALTAARAALLGRFPVTWANYALYGDPTLRIEGPATTARANGAK